MSPSRLSLLVALFLSLTCDACIYFDKALDPNRFKETERAAFLFHDGTHANLILKTGFEGKIPGELAWVFPLPSQPVHYEETNPELFNELNKIFEPARKGRGKPKLYGGGIMGGIGIHPTVKVGDYQIVPIEILSEESGGTELNAWLDKMGFNQMPANIQKPYLKKGAFFLAIKAKISGDRADLKPLWVKYASNQVRFPLRFTHDYRTFALKLYFLGPERGIEGLPSQGVEKAQMEWARFSPWLPNYPVISKTIEKAPTRSLQQYRIKGVNTEVFTKDLTQDPGFDL